MAKLRGHHLICLHFYDGEGYERGFIDNLERILEAVRREGIEVCEGPDDICDPCPHRKGEQCTFSATADREIRDMDARALSLLGLPAGRRAEWTLVREKVGAILPRWYATHCHMCTWRSACERSELYREMRGGAGP